MKPKPKLNAKKSGPTHLHFWGFNDWEKLKSDRSSWNRFAVNDADEDQDTSIALNSNINVSFVNDQSHSLWDL
jgi:hypothetical protein